MYMALKPEQPGRRKKVTNKQTKKKKRKVPKKLMTNGKRDGLWTMVKNKAQQANDGSLGILSTFSTFSTLSTFSNVKVGLPRWFS